MNKTNPAALAPFFALLVLGVLTACNTTEGIGKDVSAVGDAVSDSAEENKGY